MSGVALVLYPKGWRHYPNADVYSLFQEHTPSLCCDNRRVASNFAPGIDIILAQYRDILPFGGGHSLATSYIRDLSSILERIHPEVVITYEAYSSLTFQASKLSRRYRFKHIVLCNETGSGFASAWRVFPVTNFFATACRDNAGTFVGYTSKAVTALLSAGIPRDRIHHIHMGIDLTHYVATRGSREGSRLRIVYIGALRRNKGIRTLCTAFTELESRLPGRFELFFGGIGPLSGVVQCFASHNYNVHYLGWVGEGEKADLLRSGDIFVYPSEDIRTAGILRWQEQTAVAVIEAMASGLPVVASDSGALPEMLDQPDAIFPQGNPAQLASIVQGLSTDQESLRSRGAANRQRAERLFDIRRYATALELLFTETPKV